MRTPPYDISVERDGDSVIIFTINSDAAADWVEEKVHLESWQKLGYRKFVVDFRLALGLAQSMKADGFTVGDAES